MMRRAMAVGVDGFALQMPAAVLGAVILAGLLQVSSALGIDGIAPSFDQLSLLSVGAFLITSTLVEALLLSRLGWTPGRRLFGLELVAADGGKARFTSTLRYCSTRLAPIIVLGLTTPFVLALLVGLHVLGWWRTGRTLSELAGKLVVRVR
jgi:uncharacterized RDD family membrane protein YckC